jgi:hypothetical protein
VLPLHHGHNEAGTAGLEPAASRLTSERSAQLSYAPEGRNEKWKAGSAPRNRRQRRCRVSGASCYPSAPLPARVRAATSSPVGPGGLSRPAARKGPRSAQPLFRHFLDPPVDGSMLAHSAGGIRTHGLELMRLARTAAPLPRKAHRNPVQRSGRLDSNQCSPVPETGGVAKLPHDQIDRRPWSRTRLYRRIRPVPAQPAVVGSRREESNLRLPPSRGGARVR